MSRRGPTGLVAGLLLVAACGAPPTAGPEDGAAGGTEGAAATGGTGATDGADAAADGADPFEAVLAEVDGLEGEERRQRLVELAMEEGATLNVYTSNTDLADFAAQFAEQYGLEEPSVYRAQAHIVLQRLVEEQSAGFAGADLVDTNAEELISMQQEGLLRGYEGPALEGLEEVAIQDGWTGTRINTYVAAWNSDTMPAQPEAYEDFADPSWNGLLMVEERAYEWYMALSDYFVAQGQTQDEVDALMESIISNATRVVGNTEQAQFLAAGEFGASVNVYNHLIDEETAAGAPIAWRDPAPVEPIVLRPNGAALLRTAQNPASALLFFEWLLTDGQEPLLDEFRVPANEEVQGGILDGIETAPVDVEKLANEGDEWEERWIALLENAIGQASG